jgi:hypothetical protein
MHVLVKASRAADRVEQRLVVTPADTRRLADLTEKLRAALVFGQRAGELTLAK